MPERHGEPYGQPGTQSVSDIEADLANAQTTMTNASTLNTQTQTTLQDMLQGMEGVNQTQIGEQILTLQNSLSASMSVTARLAQSEPGGNRTPAPSSGSQTVTLRTRPKAEPRRATALSVHPFEARCARTSGHGSTTL